MPPNPLLDSKVKQIQKITNQPSLDPYLIKLDLKFTGFSVDRTVERIFDKQFLFGTARDPRRDIDAWGQEEDGGVWKGRRRRGNYASEVRIPGSSQENQEMDAVAANAGARGGAEEILAEDNFGEEGGTIYLSDSDDDEEAAAATGTGAAGGRSAEARSVRASLSKMAAVNVLATSSGNSFSGAKMLPPSSPPMPKGKGKGKEVLPDRGKGKAPFELGESRRSTVPKRSEVRSRSPPRKRIPGSAVSAVLLPESPLFQTGSGVGDSWEEERYHAVPKMIAESSKTRSPPRKKIRESAVLLPESPLFQTDSGVGRRREEQRYQPMPKTVAESSKARSPSRKSTRGSAALLPESPLEQTWRKDIQAEEETMRKPLRKTVKTYSPPRKKMRESIPLLPESPLQEDVQEEEELEILAPRPNKRKSDTIVLDLTGDNSDDEVVIPELVMSKPKVKPKPPSRVQSDPSPLRLGAFCGAFDDDFLDIDDLQPPPVPAPKLSKGLSAATLKMMEELDNNGSNDDEEDSEDGTTKPRKRSARSKSSTVGVLNKRRKISMPGLSESERSTPALSTSASPKKQRRAAEKDLEKEQRKREREEEAATKRREKEAAKEQRRLEKEAQAAEKRREQEYASVNKLVRNKAESAKEMIVDMSRALVDTVTGEQAKGFLTTLGCEVNPNWRPSMGIEAEWKVIKWRRKTKSKFDQQHRMFVPIPEVIEDEKHVMVYLTAKEFVDIAFPDDGTPGLDEHVRKMRRLVPAAGNDVKLLYLIEGLTVFVRKCVNAANKVAREEAAREQAGEEAPRRRKRKEEKSINEDDAEDALLQLQVVHNCLVHQTVAQIESAEWMSIFTGDISTIPYKNARVVLDTAFCTEVGQVKTGTDRKDTYIKMLQEIHRVTPAIAKGIEREYPDVLSLVEAFRDIGDTAVGDVPIFAGRTGSSRNIGQAMSKRIAGVFLGTDPMATAET